MGHDFVEYAGEAVVFYDAHLNLVRCLMLQVAKQRVGRDRFTEELTCHLREFYWICNGAFSDFHLDRLLDGPQEIGLFLDFLDECAAAVCAQGDRLSADFLNAVVGSSDHWEVELPAEYPLIGLGRLANLVMRLPPAVRPGDPRSWSSDQLSRRMKQQRILDNPR